MNRRRALGWLAFFTASAAVAVIPEYFFAPQQPEHLAGAPARVAPTDTAPSQPGRADAAAPVARSVPQADLFAAHSWRVAPAPPAFVPAQVALQPPPAPPMAPPLPFTFIGKLDDSERLLVFLLRGEAVHVVGVGDVIDSDYQVEHIDATEMTLVYLPLQLTQSLAVGSTR